MITNQITLHFYISHSFYFKLWASSDGILTQFRSTYKNGNFTERRRRKRTEIEAPRGISEWNPDFAILPIALAIILDKLGVEQETSNKV